MQDSASTAATTLPANWPEVTLAMSIAITLAIAIALGAARIARQLFKHIHASDTVGTNVVRVTVRVIRLVTFAISLAVFAFPALDLAGVNLKVGLHPQDLAEWATETGLRIALILTVAFLMNQFISTIIDRVQRDMSSGTGNDAVERQRRAATVTGLLRGGLAAMVWAISVLIILRELDIDITPVLTGAGILGLAVGFGAQTLVRDFISGFFMIVEDQVRVGDVAQVNGVGGAVEQINLRTIVLRDLQGTVHVFPNGSVTTLANLTKEFSFYVIDMGVDYAEDTDRVAAALIDVVEEMRRDPKYGPSILEPLEVMGVDAFADSQVTLKVRLKCIPLKQWEVGRELRRRIKKELDRRGISIPFPQLTMHVANLPAAAGGPDTPAVTSGESAPDEPDPSVPAGPSD
ncbi:MAG: mechanosensitive ion channel family protein [Vicinamibacterales bacterium]